MLKFDFYETRLTNDKKTIIATTLSSNTNFEAYDDYDAIVKSINGSYWTFKTFHMSCWSDKYSIYDPVELNNNNILRGDTDEYWLISPLVQLSSLGLNQRKTLVEARCKNYLGLKDSPVKSQAKPLFEGIDKATAALINNVLPKHGLDRCPKCSSSNASFVRMALVCNDCKAPWGGC